MTAPPTDGKANEALLRLVAFELDVPRARLTLVAGATSRSKTLCIADLSPQRVALRLTPRA